MPQSPKGNPITVIPLSEPRIRTPFNTINADQVPTNTFRNPQSRVTPNPSIHQSLVSISPSRRVNTIPRTKVNDGCMVSNKTSQDCNCSCSNCPQKRLKGSMKDVFQTAPFSDIVDIPSLIANGKALHLQTQRILYGRDFDQIWAPVPRRLHENIIDTNIPSNMSTVSQESVCVTPSRRGLPKGFIPPVACPCPGGPGGSAITLPRRSNSVGHSTSNSSRPSSRQTPSRRSRSGAASRTPNYDLYPKAFINPYETSSTPTQAFVSHSKPTKSKPVLDNPNIAIPSKDIVSRKLEPPQPIIPIHAGQDNRPTRQPSPLEILNPKIEKYIPPTPAAVAIIEKNTTQPQHHNTPPSTTPRKSRSKTPRPPEQRRSNSLPLTSNRRRPPVALEWLPLSEAYAWLNILSQDSKSVSEGHNSKGLSSNVSTITTTHGDLHHHHFFKKQNDGKDELGKKKAEIESKQQYENDLKTYSNTKAKLNKLRKQLSMNNQTHKMQPVPVNSLEYQEHFTKFSIS